MCRALKSDKKEVALALVMESGCFQMSSSCWKADLFVAEEPIPSPEKKKLKVNIECLKVHNCLISLLGGLCFLVPFVFASSKDLNCQISKISAFLEL